jgi:heme exporter protein A
VRLISENLVVIRGSRTIIDGLSFEVAAGETLLLTGPNGAGKTTLIRTLAGIARPAAGSVRLDGGDGERELSEQCHYVGHANGAKSSLTVAENLAFWAAYLGSGDESAAISDRVSRALDQFDLEPLAAIPAVYLSAGQKRRLGLARVLLSKRPLWLLDEPTVSLDAASATRLAELIGAHVAGGGIAIAATHLPLGIAGAKYLRLGAAADTRASPSPGTAEGEGAGEAKKAKPASRSSRSGGKAPK